jgi:hypothetical protein
MRVLFKTGSTVTDITRKVEKLKTDNYAMSYNVGDSIYIGQDFPFNHFYLKMGATPNAIATTMSIQCYGQNSFTSAVNVIDDTNGLFNSGFVEFTPDRQTSWQRQSTNDGSQSITELNTVYIYDLYWIKITFNQTLTASINLNWIGQKFSDDDDLFSEFPIFNDTDTMSVFESGKTSWEDQHATAADLIVKDLKGKGIIISKEQILERDQFKLASVSKVAQIIYTSFGKDYIDRVETSKKEYAERINIALPKVDLNSNAILDLKEKSNSTGWGVR